MHHLTNALGIWCRYYAEITAIRHSMLFLECTDIIELRATCMNHLRVVFEYLLSLKI